MLGYKSLNGFKREITDNLFPIITKEIYAKEIHKIALSIEKVYFSDDHKRIGLYTKESQKENDHR